MRARQPDAEGFIERDGVSVQWERVGDGEPTIVLLPTWSIVSSQHWKFQVPFLARHHRVVTFDGRGSGRSDRPTGPEHHTVDQRATDAIAVMDATATDRAVLAGLSFGALWRLQVADDHPERVLGLVLIGPAVPLGVGLPERGVNPFDEPLATTEGWAKYNRHHWLRDDRDFVDWGMEIEPATPIDGELGGDACGREHALDMCTRASAARSLVIIGGAGHGPMIVIPSSSAT